MRQPNDQSEDYDDDDKVREPNFCDRNLCCTRRGWLLFLRYLNCPCARPATVKGPADLASLKSIKLKVPYSPEEAKDLQDNQVITSKYTPWDFLPLATALQFRRAVNVYFLFQVVLLMIGNFAPSLFEVSYTPWGTLLVLIFVICVTLITEGYDDYYRHEADRVENSREVIIIDPDTGRKKRTTWGALLPGDLIVLKNRELVPADVVVLQTDRPTGKLYIETSGIDGETNLKIKSVSSEMLNYIQNRLGGGDAWRKSFRGVFEYEEPNPILSFSGSFTPADGGDPVPLAFENLVLRGSEIRNTQWVVAICVYSGHATKLVLSKKKTPSKFATIDLLINRVIYLAILQSLVFTLVAVLVLFLGTPNTGDIWYFKYSSVLNAYTLPGPLAYIFTFVNFFSNVVPIDLYVTIELANVFQSYMLTSDIQMYDPVTNTRAGTKTTNLISEIGQVSHVFSDKTGTLTQNVMRLVGCALPNGRGRFGVQVPDPVMEETTMEAAAATGGAVGNDEEAPASSSSLPSQMMLTASIEDTLGKRELNQREVFADLLALLQQGTKEAVDFMIALVLCHTVIVDLDDEGLPRYNAEGPDEEALVKAAALLGFVLRSTDNNRYVVFAMGEVRDYEVIAIFPFTHDRKRMSILVRRVTKQRKGDGEEEMEDVPAADGDEVLLITKGADNIVSQKLKHFEESINRDLSAFAQSGLRTLLVAQRTFTYGEVKPLMQEFTAAKQLIGKAKTVAIGAVADKMEAEMDLVGATAIEDALQEGVPETIQMLRDAGIKVWVLTGDKVDTAVNIGFSSRLLDPTMHQIILTSPATAISVMETALDVLNRASLTANAPPDTEWVTKSLALVVDGATLETLLDKQKGTTESQDKLIRLARRCAVVLACRVSPSQKALLLKACADGEPALAREAQASCYTRWFRPKKRSPVTLAIGDGANDVAMIQQAKVGVGISGKEGLQAANSADFSIAQFRYLQRLLFVHGRWSYIRNATLFRFVCYSWQVLNWGIFFYLFQSMISGLQVYVVTYYVTAFAWICNFVIVGIAWFDRDVSAETVLKYPHSYDLGRLNQLLKLRRIFVEVFLRALVHALIMYYVTVVVFPPQSNLDILGSTMYMALFSIMTAMQVMIAMTWTWLIFAALAIIIIAYFIVISMIDIFLSTSGVALLFTFSWPTAYVSAFLVVFTIIAFEYAFFGSRRIFNPTPMEALIEADRGYADADTRPKLHGIRDAFEAVREGNDRVFVVPIKSVIKRMRMVGKDRTAVSEETAEEENAQQTGAQVFKSGRPTGFVDSTPDVGDDSVKL